LIFINTKINFLNKKKMNKEQIMGLIRHVLTFVGGVIITKGLASDAMTSELIGGIMTVVGATWSILSKKTAA
jgi:hypothetical protein